MSKFEYRTTFAPVPSDFPNHDMLAETLSKLAPKPPRNEDWQLVSSATVVTSKGTYIIYSWERPVAFDEASY